ncbi:MAG TPA: ComF family protein [Pyrinomonadaceae bacterium]|nr:ComF family protein [Pyrinomonadaceae bacterium]
MRITHSASLCYDSILSLVYPQSCVICCGSVESRALGVACSKCWRETRIFSGRETVCWKCGLQSSGSAPEQRREEVRCHRCDELEFTVARACGVYEGALRASVLTLKHQPDICGRLIDLLVATQARHPLNKATVIIPVPLHTDREKARGFNQAALLAHKLADASRLPFDNVSLTRTSHTERHRAGMDATDRRKTVDKAFQVVHPALVRGESVLLVDDVFTTGATVSSCATALLDAGAAEVFVLTVARPMYF